jgi:hypothetical protein
LLVHGGDDFLESFIIQVVFGPAWDALRENLFAKLVANGASETYWATHKRLAFMAELEFNHRDTRSSTADVRAAQ